MIALSHGGEAHEVLAGPNGACQLGPCDAELGRRVALQSTEAQDGQLVTDLIDPRGVVAGQEVALGDEEGDERRSPRPYPVLLSDCGLSAENRLDGGFEVD